MGIIERLGLCKRRLVIEQPKVRSLGDTLAESGHCFPWGLLSQDEKNAVDKEIRGVASVTNGGVILSPWQCVSEEKAKELADYAQGIERVVKGLSDPNLYKT